MSRHININSLYIIVYTRDIHKIKKYNIATLLKHIVDIYINSDISYMEAKTTAALCIGQPVKNVVKKDRKLDDC